MDAYYYIDYFSDTLPLAAALMLVSLAWLVISSAIPRLKNWIFTRYTVAAALPLVGMSAEPSSPALLAIALVSCLFVARYVQLTGDKP
jgi:hypothetical protein